MRLVVLALVCGCAETPSTSPLSLQVDISSGSGEVFTLDDGSTSMTASFAKDYPASTERPAIARLPVKISGTPVEIELDSCDLAGRELATEHVTYTDVSRLDMYGVVGMLAYDCSYDDGQSLMGSKSSGIEADPNKPAPPL